MTSKEFDIQLSAIRTQLLTKEQGNIPKEQWNGFVHIATQCMRDAFESGKSGSGATADLIATMETAHNPLAEAIASAMRWSFEQGQKARI